MYGFGQTIAKQVAVCGLFASMPIAQFVDMLDEKFPIEGIRMIEVDRFTFLIGEVCSVIVI